MTETIQEPSLHERLQPRIAVEEYFARIGHTYRHGPVYRNFERYFARPMLKYGLRLAGLYETGVRNALSPVVREFELSYPNLPKGLDGFELLHISDLLIDGSPGLVEALTPVLRGLAPDVCVLTGDYRFEDRGSCAEVYPLMAELQRSISARHGIYGILGNHDAAEIALALEDMGVRMLVNDAAEIVHRGDSLWLAGVDDPFDYRTDDLASALSGVPSNGFKVLLAHAPELYDQAADEAIDLYLCGHTHAGQIRVPKIGALRQNAKCPKAFAYGLWQHKGMRGYTTAGAGCSALPIRYNCPPEVALFRLRSER